VTLKLKTIKFELITRSITSKIYFDSSESIENLALKLLEAETLKGPLKIRLMGITISKFKSKITSTSTNISNFFGVKMVKKEAINDYPLRNSGNGLDGKDDDDSDGDIDVDSYHDIEYCREDNDNDNNDDKNENDFEDYDPVYWEDQSGEEVVDFKDDSNSSMNTKNSKRSLCIDVNSNKDTSIDAVRDVNNFIDNNSSIENVQRGSIEHKVSTFGIVNIIDCKTSSSSNSNTDSHSINFNSSHTNAPPLLIESPPQPAPHQIISSSNNNINNINNINNNNNNNNKIHISTNPPPQPALYQNTTSSLTHKQNYSCPICSCNIFGTVVALNHHIGM
jgi:hypothetical protein